MSSTKCIQIFGAVSTAAGLKMLAVKGPAPRVPALPKNLHEIAQRYLAHKGAVPRVPTLPITAPPSAAEQFRTEIRDGTEGSKSMEILIEETTLDCLDIIQLKGQLVASVVRRGTDYADCYDLHIRFQNSCVHSDDLPKEWNDFTFEQMETFTEERMSQFFQLFGDSFWTKWPQLLEVMALAGRVEQNHVAPFELTNVDNLDCLKAFAATKIKDFHSTLNTTLLSTLQQMNDSSEVESSATAEPESGDGSEVRFLCDVPVGTDLRAAIEAGTQNKQSAVQVADLKKYLDMGFVRLGGHLVASLVRRQIPAAELAYDLRIHYEIREAIAGPASAPQTLFDETSADGIDFSKDGLDWLRQTLIKNVSQEQNMMDLQKYVHTFQLSPEHLENVGTLQTTIVEQLKVYSRTLDEKFITE